MCPGKHREAHGVCWEITVLKLRIAARQTLPSDGGEALLCRIEIAPSMLKGPSPQMMYYASLLASTVRVWQWQQQQKQLQANDSPG